jgi:alcohol dehydrogenase (cytochrome c)
MISRRALFAGGLASAFVVFSLGAQAQVTSQRLVAARNEAQNWLTYSGNYSSTRYSPLDQITPANVRNLKLQWVYQAPVAGNWQTTPLVVDGVMYITQRLNDVVALDAATGRAFWTYRYTPDAQRIVCCGANNRGLAILGDTLFMGTLDAQLIAIDTKSGHPIWTTEVANTKSGYSITHAPLVVKDKVIVGVGGGEYGIRGFIAAYNVATGREVWRFYTIPAPGEPGSETWQRCAQTDPVCDPDAWKHGGGSIWMTGSYDPQLNLTYWGVGNVGPDYNGVQRPGDNLYTDSVVALDADTGKLKWHYQFTPHDLYDYDSVQVPVLVDNWAGSGVNVVTWANRNGNFYVLNRETGRFLLGKPFVKVNWMSEFDERGRPKQTPQPEGQPTYPGNQGGTNWYSPSFSQRTGLFYVSAWEDYASIYSPPAAQYKAEYKEGGNFGGSGPRNASPVPGAPGLGRGPINNWTETAGHGAVIAIDPVTGREKWKFKMTDVTDSGILTTGSDLLFTGGREGFFQALDARTGALLWRTNLGAAINSGPISFRVGNKQYVSIVSGLSLFVFGLDE